MLVCNSEKNIVIVFNNIYTENPDVNLGSQQ